jgi:hypothetical protein
VVLETVSLVAILAIVVFMCAWIFTPFPARFFGYGIGRFVAWVTRSGRH